MAQDVKIIKGADGIYDIPIVDGDFDIVDGIETSVGVSIGTDARENEGNVQEAFRRSGWSGNLLTIQDSYELGSTLWSSIARMIPNTNNITDGKIRKCLQWLINDDIIDALDVDISQISSRISRIQLVLYKGLNEVGRYVTLFTNTQSF